MNNRIDPFDELAAMFLTAPHPSAPLPPSDRPTQQGVGSVGRVAGGSVMTELLLVGHLPVRAGLWLVPYADALAREVGTVGLVRLDGQEPSLQLLRAPEQWATLPMNTTLRQSIMSLTPSIDMWLIRGSERLGADEALDCRCDRITILSSADEAAVVAAYQTIKELAQAAEHPHRTLPVIGLAMVGCDSRSAETVIDRLNRTTVSFLGVEVKLVALLPRMDAGIKCTRYVTFSEESLPRALEVRSWVEQAKMNRESHTQPPSSQPFAIPHPPQADEPASPYHSNPSVIGRIAPPPETFVHDARRILRRSEEFETATSGSSRQFESPDRSGDGFPRPAAADSTTSPTERDELVEHIAGPRAKENGRRLPPKVVIDLEHKLPSDQRPVIEPSENGEPLPLARFVAGLKPLRVRPPGHERIELAVDDAGCIHLLAREQSLRDLAVVRRWAHAHRELLAMACADLRFDPAGTTICHVFSAEPAMLADLHGSDLHLHVLAPVSIGDQTAWYAAPLNVVK